MQWSWWPHEVIALYRWSAGETVNHLRRAWCCVLLCVGDEGGDESLAVAPGLVDSCLALGGEAPGLAEALFAWCAGTGHPDGADDDGAEPEWLLALLLLRAAADPGDARIAVLVRLLTGHPWYPPEQLGAALAGAVTAQLWRQLIGRLLVPARHRRPELDGFLAALGR